MTHDELIAALESATESSRELDVAISVAVGREDETTIMRYTDGTEKRHPTSRNPWGEQVDSPRYTASIDAALTLVPVNYDRLVCCINGKWQATCGPENSFQDVGDQKGATPAIALCIAALKAREKK